MPIGSPAAPGLTVGVPMLSEAFERKDKRFDFACRATSGCFDCCFVLEEEIFWVGFSIELRENGWVESGRPRELFKFYGERSCEVLLRANLLRTKLMWHPVLAFLVIRVLFSFNDNWLLAKPLRLRRLLHGPGVLAKRLHHHQTISE